MASCIIIILWGNKKFCKANVKIKVYISLTQWQCNLTISTDLQQSGSPQRVPYHWSYVWLNYYSYSPPPHIDY